MWVCLIACMLGLLITIALCANVLELMTKFYTHISDIKEVSWVQVYNTHQKPFVSNVLENFVLTFTLHTFVLAQMAPLLP